MLQPLGISPAAESVYVALGSGKTSSVAELMRHSDLDLPSALDAVDELHRLGLAVEIGSDRWQSLPITEIAKALQVERQSELDRALAAAESLQARLVAAAQAQSDDIRVLVGRDEIIPVHKQLFELATKEICVFDKPPYVQQRDATVEALDEDAPEWRAMRRGVRLRCVYHPGFDNERLRELLLFASHGEDSRTAPVPMKLIILDAAVAMIPSMRSYQPGHESVYSVVRHPTLVEALQWLFEGVWDVGVPIQQAASEAGDPRRQMLVSLLMTGSTDSAIANSLGLNVRSIRRWIAELMEEFGVETRLQLGAALVRAERARAQTERATSS